MKYRGFSKIFEKKYIVSCLNCEIGYVYPQPSKVDISNYNKNYFKNAHSYEKQSSIIDNYNNAISKVRLLFLSDHIQYYKKKINNILEIGPGYGHLMINWLTKYPKSKYFIDETDVSLLSKLKLRGSFLISNNLKEKKIDLVIISHVLEHSLKPIEFIKEKSKFLKKGGLIFIEVPCNDYIYKNNFEPHTLFFSKKSLQYTLIKSGFKKISLSYHGDTHNNIIYFELIKKIILKLSIILKLPVNFFFIKKIPTKIKEKLNQEECKSLILTSPHKTSENPSRWLRAIAEKV